jgi:hypothetical protein
MRRMITDLAALLAPASVEELLAAMAEPRRLFVRAADTRRFDDVLPWTTINGLFTINRFPPGQVRLLQAGNELQPHMYRDAADPWRLRLHEVQSLAAQGVTILINGIDRFVPSVDAVGAMLERRVRARRWVNAYLSFSRPSAFRPHWDTHDVVVLQIHGQKRWRSYGLAGDAPIAPRAFGRGEDPGPVQWEGVLEPGDVLYLPRGEVHVAETASGTASVHLTCGLRRPRGSDVLRWLASRDEAVLRRDVFSYTGGLAHRSAELKAALHDVVDRIDLEAFLADAEREREQRTAMNLGAGGVATPGTLLRCALSMHVALPASPDARVSFAAGGVTYELTPEAARLLAVLQDRDGLTIADAQAALGVDDLRDAATELAQKGLVHLSLPR